MSYIWEILSYLIGAPILISICYIFVLPFYLVLEIIINFPIVVIKKINFSIFIKNYIKLILIRYILLIIIGTLLQVVKFKFKTISIFIDKLDSIYIIIGVILSMIVVSIYYSNKYYFSENIKYFLKPMNLFIFIINSLFISLHIYFIIIAVMSV